MKKNLITILILTLLVLTVLLMPACGNKASSLVGQWEIENTEGTYAPFDTLEFFSDNTYASDFPNYNGNYSVDGDRIKLSGILVEPLTCSYRIKGKTLSLTHEDATWTFVKV